MFKKQRLCSKCNEKLGQGHRADRCDEIFSKTYKPSHNKMYVSPKYKNMSFERIETPHAFASTTSGAILGRPVPVQEFAQGLYELQDAIKNKIDNLPADVKADIEKGRAMKSKK